MCTAWRNCLALLAALVSATAACGEIIIRDITYESPGSTNHVLDLYLPDGWNHGERPTILWLHPGAWYGGTRRDQDGLYQTLANEGQYACVSAEYTLSPVEGGSFPQAVVDVKAVVRWIRTDGQAYNLSPRIVSTGSSAGGHLSGMLATTGDLTIFDPPLSLPPGGYRVNGIVIWYGVHDFPWEMENGPGELDAALQRFLGVPYDHTTKYRYAAASPVTWVSRGDAPAIQHHGTADTLVPIQHSQFLDNTLRAAGVWSRFIPREGAGHGLEYWGGHAEAARIIMSNLLLFADAHERGDLNCDGSVDFADINPFVIALGDPKTYYAAYPYCDHLLADCNRDGVVDFGDVNAFVQLLGRD
jgi:acetyl esterase/lipase